MPTTPQHPSAAFPEGAQATGGGPLRLLVGAGEVPRRAHPARRGAILVIWAFFGASPLFAGFYDVTTWGPVAIGLIGLALGLLVTDRERLPRPAAAALAGVAGLSALSLISSIWAESAPSAATEANRWALYVALLLVGILLVRDRLDRMLALAAAAGAGAAIVVGLAVVLAVGRVEPLFFVGRLTNPLGYVNGQACALLLVMWPAVALAESGRRAVFRGLGAGVSVLCLGLLLLTQSRGGILALAISAAAMLAFVPGRVGRGWLLLVLACATAIAAPDLLAVYSAAPRIGGLPAVRAADVHAAVRLLIAVAVVAGVAWPVIGRVTRAAGARLPPGLGRRLAAGVLIVALIGGTAGAWGAVGDPVAKVRTQIHAFTHLGFSFASSSRLLSAGGNRYDYWRVAVREFSARPVLGVGAGNYTARYFALRRTAEDVQQPHSLELQTLSELGLAGLLTLALAVAGFLTAALARLRDARDDTVERGLTVAALGASVAWFTHTSVDWIHLLPGVSGMAICLALPLFARERGAPLARRRLAPVVAAALLLVAAAVGVARLTVSRHLQNDARAALATDPRQAIRLAADALNAQPDVLPSLFIEAAGYARLDDYSDARAALLRATRLEPDNFIPWALLGDLAVRHGDRRVAHQAYLRAHARNPLDPTLAATVTQTA